ncbi:aminoglycoside phosphotransferase family protein [Streptomyces sp. ActVer]|uniref:aminoglycoside phosphotransferase family protein n=1 Tax=Streptomyces sp. ActVer TaxID=3014558 RepID=UPI0022B5BB08|nr:aminoglycoside phosphotransferase family protein [Streptomyces sp. ActVer]MCZ4510175.1 aminoglycoside phosphotransferase family protein [Streptomyces sp. ActVer]
MAEGGYHNRNYVLPLTDRLARLVGRRAGTSATVRIRRAEALPVVIRTWDDEAVLLDAVSRVLPQVPVCLARREGSALHSYVEGVPLSRICPDGKPVDMLLLKAVTELLAQTSQVGEECLPPLPGHWPLSGDSEGFLRTLAELAEQQIRQSNWTEFGGLFAALGISDDALIELARRVPRMERRPYGLLHADLHRGNVIVSYSGAPPLICVDWELATYGDPLHDLATHLVRMRYPDFQWDEVIQAWADSTEALCPAALNGLAKDLRHYIAFERAQSVFPDLMRAAKSLEADNPDQRSLDASTAAVRGALEAAAEPLRLSHVPDETEIERTLLRWRAGRPGRTRGPQSAPAMHWRPDSRIPEHPDFPRSAVLGALIAEGAVPAERVLKGTAHLNSVVRVPGVHFPVVVRRRLASARRSEPCFLSEHAVLRAVERSGLAVTAPRVLALGESLHGSIGMADPFAIHTYAGPFDSDQPPDHPVNGLRPHEADGLVDQLCALTWLDHWHLDPMGAAFDFCAWLIQQLVRLVADLPSASRKLARQLGLPDAQRLHEIFAEPRVTPRRPTLLHGDLNPWNLVRRGDALALTLIDWEKAMVGDPLYDLVRHMHLTPTRPEIRDRMFRRWSLRLPHDCTQDWQKDWHVYRRIENVRSAYVDLDRLVAGADLDAPNVRRAVDSYASTLDAATAALGLPARLTANPYLARALPDRGDGGARERRLTGDL